MPGSVSDIFTVPMWCMVVLFAAISFALLCRLFHLHEGYVSSRICVVITSQFAPVSQYMLIDVLLMYMGSIGPDVSGSWLVNGMNAS